LDSFFCNRNKWWQAIYNFQQFETYLTLYYTIIALLIGLRYYTYQIVGWEGSQNTTRMIQKMYILDNNIKMTWFGHTWPLSCFFLRTTLPLTYFTHTTGWHSLKLKVPKLHPYRFCVDEICLHLETDISTFVRFLFIYQSENLNAIYATVTSSRSHWTECSNPYTLSDVSSIDADAVIKTDVEILEE
jgi:hypothetical protein